MNPSPYIVAIGGTLASPSSTERALRRVLDRAERLGATTLLLAGPDLDLPAYTPQSGVRCEAAARLVEAMKRADAVVIGSPGYHGGPSGLVKNALDYIADLRDDSRCYLDGRPVGCVATGGGSQGAASTLAALRTIVHALRGWPTPLGAAINTTEPVFDENGVCRSASVAETLDAIAEQLVSFVSGHQRRLEQV